MAWFVLGFGCGFLACAALLAIIVFVPSRRERIARRFFQHKARQRRRRGDGALTNRGMSASSARRLTRLEASVEIARRGGQ